MHYKSKLIAASEYEIAVMTGRNKAIPSQE